MGVKEKMIKICDFVIESGFLAIIFLVPIIFDFTFTGFNVFVLYKSVIFRFILSLVLAFYTAKIFILEKIDYKGSKKIFLFSLFLLAVFFISSFFSISSRLSFWGSYERQQGFYNLANYLLFFVLLILNIKNFKQIKRLIVATLLAGFLTCIYGLVQFFGLDPLPWKESGLATGRIFSSLGQPNFFGQYLIILLPLSIYTFFFIVKKFLTKFFVFLIILAEIFCLLSTYSRAAWLGFMAAAVVFIFIYLLLKKYKKTALGFAALILFSAGLVFSLNYYSPKIQSGPSQLNIVNRLKSMVDLNGGSNRMRLYYWQSAVKEIKQENLKRLVLGYGPETLASIFIKYYQPNWAIYETIDTYPDRAHNWIFGIILSFGFLGFIAILIFYAYFIFKTIKFLFGREKNLAEEVWLAVALSCALTAYCVNNLFSFSLCDCYIYLFFILALLWFLVGGSEKKEAMIRLTIISRVIIWLALIAVLGLFIYSENINPARADFYYMKGKKAEGKSDCLSVLDNIGKAVDYSPQSDYYRERYIFHGLNCFSVVNDKNSRLSLKESLEEQISLIDINKTQYNLKLTIARAYSLFAFYVDNNYYNRAEEIFDKLIAQHPYFLTPYQDLARMKMWQGNYQEVISILAQAEKYFPDLNDANLNQNHKDKIIEQAVSLYEKMGYSYGKLKDHEQAVKYYQSALRLKPRRADLYKGLADVYYSQGQINKALELNKRGLMIEPNNYQWYFSLSLLYQEQKNLAEAKKYLEQAYKLAPDNKQIIKLRETNYGN